eukprot:jgi/Mesvir1/14983/Mv14645-RA.1
MAATAQTCATFAKAGACQPVPASEFSGSRLKTKASSKALPGRASHQCRRSTVRCVSSAPEERKEYRKNVWDFELLDRILPKKMTKQSTLVPCPSTVWDTEGLDAFNRPAANAADMAYEFPLVIHAPEDAKEGLEWFEKNKEDLLKKVEKHGAVLLKGFSTTKAAPGLRQMFQVLGLIPCEDPLSKTGLRKSVDPVVYETVNNLPAHYVGMHNEATTLLAPRHACFTCFVPADEGGEFQLLDGRRMYRELDANVLNRLMSKGVRFKVAGFDFSFLPDNKLLRQPLMVIFEKLFLGLTKEKFDLSYHWNNSTGKNLLEAVEPVQPPVTRHPVTKVPVWFCNVHNHSRYLREHRECDVPEVAMTETYLGDMQKIPLADLDHINEVTNRNIVNIKMQSGDSILLDNYYVLHGRKTFKNIANKRLHSVVWMQN